MFEVVVYKDETLSEGAKLALKHRLYVSGWMLRKMLIRHTETSRGELAIGKLDGVPVCVATHNYGHLMAFCRKALRRKGYASHCVKRLNTTNLYARSGIEGSHYFWMKNNIEQ